LPEKRTFAEVTCPKARLRTCQPRSTEPLNNGENESVKGQSEIDQADNLKTRNKLNRKEGETVTTTKEKPIIFLCGTQIETAIQKRLLCFRQVA
jgi:hypothetical protein